MKNTLYTLLAAAPLLLFSCAQGEKTGEAPAQDSTTEAAPADVTGTSADTLEISGHIEFPSKDGLMITADSYESLPGRDFILLCHQADFSRGEYAETAKKLNAMGYNCLAIDQRSGNACNEVENLTAKRAREKGLKTDYADAMQDIEAAIDYIHKKSGHKIIAVGSSYSAALLLKIAKQSDKISALVLFSPGEYIKGTSLKKEISGLDIPVFATSSKKEAKAVADLLSGVTGKEVFVPAAEGDHGSKVLWPNTTGNEEYWSAFEAFLKKHSEASL